jgi:hypothetical protein
MSPEQVLAQYVTQAYRTLNPVVPSQGVYASAFPDIQLPYWPRSIIERMAISLSELGVGHFVWTKISASPESQSWPVHFASVGEFRK